MSEQKFVDREVLYEKARAFLHDVVEFETAYCFENNDNEPTTFADYLADVITYLQRFIDGDVEHVAYSTLSSLASK